MYTYTDAPTGPIKIKFFENGDPDRMERQMNNFLSDGDVVKHVVDIKVHVDPQIDPKWEGVCPCYFAMVMYR